MFLKDKSLTQGNDYDIYLMVWLGLLDFCNFYFIFFFGVSLSLKSFLFVGIMSFFKRI